MLLAASILIVFIAAAHSYLGERFILKRLFRQPLPPLFGSDDFTKQTLRFAWHITSVLGLGFATLLILIHVNPLSNKSVLYAIGSTFAVVALFPLVATRGKHVSWIAFLVIAGLCFTSAIAD